VIFDHGESILMTCLTRRVRLALVLLTGAAALAGASCGSSKVPVYPVRGQVLYQGKPAEGALVIFHPTSGAIPPGAPMLPNGRVQADGSFTLTTYTDNDGAPAGEYVVVILWPSGGTEGDEESSGSHDRLQGRYGDVARSPIKREVQPGENVLEPIQLK
jgi:hypothetical protein